MKSVKKGKLLFSIDLEDVRDQIVDGQQYRERVPSNTHQYLKFLSDHHARGTFFVVGETARKYPDLIHDIIQEGHEIACHSDKHVQLDKQTPESFSDDIKFNLDALHNAGATSIIGYRAPTFSLTEQTRWAYAILAQFGIKYSSSVLPVKSPLYGWPEFGFEPRMIDGIFELPINLHSFPMPRLPVAGGVYFRAIPYLFTKTSVKQCIDNNTVILTYLHPYDIDVEQERFMHPDIDNKWHLNWLMHFNRSSTLPKLEKLTNLCDFQAYDDFYRLTTANLPA